MAKGSVKGKFGCRRSRRRYLGANPGKTRAELRNAQICLPGL
jgi:hypothetical protein